MKKRLRGININISNRAFYSIILLAISILVVSVVFAFGTTTPSAFGHSAKELDLSQGVNGNAVFLGSVQIAGDANVTGLLKLGFSSACSTGNEGSLRYSSSGKNIEFCNGTSWGQLAGTAAGGAYTGPLVNGVHTGTDCTGGVFGLVVDDGSGNKFCKIDGNTCPSGWTKYQQWSRTIPTSCGDSTSPNADCGCAPATTCTTSSHSTFSNTSSETCNYNWIHPFACSGTPCQNRICTATILTIGCY